MTQTPDLKEISDAVWTTFQAVVRVRAARIAYGFARNVVNMIPEPALYAFPPPVQRAAEAAEAHCEHKN